MSQIAWRERMRDRATPQPVQRLERPLAPLVPHQEPAPLLSIPPANSPGPITTAATMVPVSPPTVPPLTLHTEATSFQLAPGGAALTPPPAKTAPEETLGDDDGFRLNPTDLSGQDLSGQD